MKIINLIIKRTLSFILLFISFHSFSQQIQTLSSVKTLPGGKCYWSYSVERIKTTDDSIHHYTISVSLSQVDSTGKPSGLVKINDAIIYCEFTDRNEKVRKAICKRKGKYWTAKFVIHTNEILPVKIIARYNKQERVMSLKLNTGSYPGEDNDVPEEPI